MDCVCSLEIKVYSLDIAIVFFFAFPLASPRNQVPMAPAHPNC